MACGNCFLCDDAMNRRINPCPSESLESITITERIPLKVGDWAQASHGKREIIFWGISFGIWKETVNDQRKMRPQTSICRSVMMIATRLPTEHKKVKFSLLSSFFSSSFYCLSTRSPKWFIQLMEIHEIYFVQKSLYLNVWPSFLQDSSQATIEAELAFSAPYMTDDVHKYCREAVCILATKHCSLNPFLSPHA